jgi:hypothetical protein
MCMRCTELKEQIEVAKELLANQKCERARNSRRHRAWYEQNRDRKIAQVRQRQQRMKETNA